MTDLLARLRELEAAATDGPWEAASNAYGVNFVHGGPEQIVEATGTKYRALVCGGNDHDTLTVEDAVLIVAMRNALPDLLNTIDQQAARIEALEREIEGLRSENERLSQAVCSGILGGLLEEAETAALVDFIKMLREQPK